MYYTYFEFILNRNSDSFFITGSEKAFAAGADIKQMQHRKFAENFQGNFLGHWGNIANVRKPIIAAVNGFALGGGKYTVLHIIKQMLFWA